VNNLQDILLFPFRDAEARKQFLIACLVALAGFIIPLVPFIFLMGYSARIMRQIIDERKSPSMPDWQESDPSEMFMDGLRLYGSQLVLTLPLLLLMGCGITFMVGGSLSMAIPTDNGSASLAPVGILFFLLGIGSMMLFTLLSFPYGVVISAVGPHVVTQRSFSAAFQFKDWWAIFRKGLSQFILNYLLIMVVSFVFMFVIQFAMITIVLMCIVPLLMIPYTAYLSLATNALYAQADLAGIDNSKDE